VVVAYASQLFEVPAFVIFVLTSLPPHRHPLARSQWQVLWWS
jgi:hypothetical protein